MREIGSLPPGHAPQRLADYLLTLGIRTRVDAQPGGDSSIWVFEEDQRDAAREALAQFLQNPHDPRYDEAAKQARQLERAAVEKERRYRKNAVDLRNRWNGSAAGRRPVTVGLVSISCGVALLLGFGSHIQQLAELWITPPVVLDGQVLGFVANLSKTIPGEMWRLVTPIFIHMTLAHLVFNMFVTLDLGSQIEFRLGSWRMAGMVLVLAVLSNLAQFYQAGPQFGGMSGVAYGLFGYIWIRSWWDPGSGFSINPSTVVIMLAWFVACFTPLLGDVANAAHTAGLGTGVILAFLTIFLRRTV